MQKKAKTSRSRLFLRNYFQIITIHSYISDYYISQRNLNHTSERKDDTHRVTSRSEIWEFNVGSVTTAAKE